MEQEAKKKKILVVDDEPDVLTVISKRLKSAGFDIVTRTNGKEGLDADPPDLIVADVVMPEMDGYTFYKELKKNKVTSSIPVLILTARGHMEDSFRVAGADDFIAKPFEAEDLLQRVNKLLNRPKAGHASEKAIRVLVAGNDDDIVKEMIMQLKREGYYTDFVLSGAQVISKAVLFLPQVLIIDIQLFGMEADEIINVLRHMPQFGKMPIIAYSYYQLSDLGSEDTRQRALSVDVKQQACMGAGATEYMGRFSENTLMTIIKKYS